MGKQRRPAHTSFSYFDTLYCTRTRVIIRSMHEYHAYTYSARVSCDQYWYSITVCVYTWYASKAFFSCLPINMFAPLSWLGHTGKSTGGFQLTRWHAGREIPYRPPSAAAAASTGFQESPPDAESTTDFMVTVSTASLPS